MRLWLIFCAAFCTAAVSFAATVGKPITSGSIGRFYFLFTETSSRFHLYLGTSPNPDDMIEHEMGDLEAPIAKKTWFFDFTGPLANGFVYVPYQNGYQIEGPDLLEHFGVSELRDKPIATLDRELVPLEITVAPKPLPWAIVRCFYATTSWLFGRRKPLP